MIPKSSHKVFFAFPYDGATKPMYDNILRDLKSKFEDGFEFIYGSRNVISPSQKFSNIDLFKSQNTDLLNQFLTNIKSADVIVADLTYNNPNVHVELGIAITLNKNILRVSGRDLVEIGSDIKGYEVNVYRCEKDLRKIIEDYLKRFREIKNLPLDKKAGHFYKEFYGKKETIDHRKDHPAPISPIHRFSMRDGALKVKFKWGFSRDNSGKDWFGVYFRYGSQNPWAGGLLLYIRRNGMMELAELPNVTILGTKRFPALQLQKEYSLCLGFDGNNLIATINNKDQEGLRSDKLTIQSIGNVALGCFNSEVIFRQVKTVCRDTIKF